MFISLLAAGKVYVHACIGRQYPPWYEAGSSKTSFSLMPCAGRLFMKQFLLRQTMDDADEAASGGSYFIDIASWIPDLNHILIATGPLPFLLLQFLPSSFLSIARASSRSFPFTLCVPSYRGIIHKRSLEEARRTRTAFHWEAFITRLPRLHLCATVAVIRRLTILIWVSLSVYYA